MNDWQHTLPHTVASPHRGQNLDFGRTVPLTHAPIHMHQIPGQFTSVNSGHLSANQYSYGLSNYSLSIPRIYPTNQQINTKTNRQRKPGSQSEKKRWQTADFRWMFTKRKGIMMVKVVLVIGSGC